MTKAPTLDTAQMEEEVNKCCGFLIHASKMAGSYKLTQPTEELKLLQLMIFTVQHTQEIKMPLYKTLNVSPE